MDPPGLYPGNIHARHTQLQLVNSVALSDYERVALRRVYCCSGSCRRIVPKEAKHVYSKPLEDLAQYVSIARDQKRNRSEAPEPYSENDCSAKLMVRLVLSDACMSPGHEQQMYCVRQESFVSPPHASLYIDVFASCASSPSRSRLQYGNDGNPSQELYVRQRTGADIQGGSRESPNPLI